MFVDFVETFLLSIYHKTIYLKTETLRCFFILEDTAQDYSPYP